MAQPKSSSKLLKAACLSTLPFLFLNLLSHHAAAKPQGNASIISGVCGSGSRSALWERTCWYNALHADILFGRERNSDIGVGPYVEVATLGFEDLRLGGGGSLQLPIHHYVPAVLSLGGYAKYYSFSSDAGEEGRWEPGLAADLFVGARSFNFHSDYVMVGGLSLGARYGLGDSEEVSFIIAAQIDTAALWLPGLFIYQWLKGSPSR